MHVLKMISMLVLLAVWLSFYSVADAKPKPNSELGQSFKIIPSIIAFTKKNAPPKCLVLRWNMLASKQMKYKTDIVKCEGHVFSRKSVNLFDKIRKKLNHPLQWVLVDGDGEDVDMQYATAGPHKSIGPYMIRSFDKPEWFLCSEDILTPLSVRSKSERFLRVKQFPANNMPSSSLEDRCGWYLQQSAKNTKMKDDGRFSYHYYYEISQIQTQTVTTVKQYEYELTDSKIKKAAGYWLKLTTITHYDSIPADSQHNINTPLSWPLDSIISASGEEQHYSSDVSWPGSRDADANDVRHEHELGTGDSDSRRHRANVINDILGDSLFGDAADSHIVEESSTGSLSGYNVRLNAVVFGSSSYTLWFNANPAISLISGMMQEMVAEIYVRFADNNIRVQLVTSPHWFHVHIKSDVDSQQKIDKDLDGLFTAEDDHASNLNLKGILYCRPHTAYPISLFAQITLPSGVAVTDKVSNHDVFGWVKIQEQSAEDACERVLDMSNVDAIFVQYTQLFEDDEGDEEVLEHY
jgi:hypothetical protein